MTEDELIVKDALTKEFETTGFKGNWLERRLKINKLDRLTRKHMEYLAKKIVKGLDETNKMLYDYFKK